MTSSQKTLIDLGFGLREAPGGLTTPWRGQEGGAPPPGVVALWPLSGSLSVFFLRPRKIEVLAFVSSNSENIFCVAFLKHKNS
jgi:hypothetical protein